MKKAIPITTLFLDIGGALLTDGWDHHARKRAAANFKLEWAEMENRHSLNFNTYEEGKLTLEEYLARVVFHKKRPFARAQFQRFMFAQSKPCPEMIELFIQLKVRYGLKIIVISNEGRELNAYWIREFKLDRFVDAFISSELNEARNAGNGGVISTDASRVKVRVIHTDEEQMIARSVCRALGPGIAGEKGNSSHAT